MDDNTSTDPIAEALASDDDQPTVTYPEAVETESQEEVATTEPEAEETTETEEQPETETTPEVEPSNEQEEELQTQPDPAEEARRRYEERQTAKAERDARVQQATQEHLKGAEDEYDERLRAVEADRYQEKVVNTENSLINEFERVKANPELQIFNPDSEVFNQKAYDKAIRDYNAGYVDYDQYGNMVGTKGSLFEHLTETAELLSGAVKSGAVQQVRATRQMRSGADTKPAATPKSAPKDDILDILKSD